MCVYTHRLQSCWRALGKEVIQKDVSSSKLFSFCFFFIIKLNLLTRAQGGNFNSFSLYLQLVIIILDAHKISITEKVAEEGNRFKLFPSSLDMVFDNKFYGISALPVARVSPRCCYNSSSALILPHGCK